MAVSKKGKILSWAFFDFGNSAFSTLVLTFVYNTYYTTSIAVDPNVGAAQWGMAVAVASVMIAVLSPVLGAAADVFALKKRFMGVAIGIGALATAFLYFPEKGQEWWALSFFVVAVVATELSIVFNNAFLPELAPKSEAGRVSGFAFALGYAGGLLCLLIAMNGFVVSPDKGEPWFGLSWEGGQSVRATSLLVAVWLVVFSIPVMVFLKDKKRSGSSRGMVDVTRQSFVRLKDTFFHLRDYRTLFGLLLARLFYNDGLVAIFSFGGVYATVVFGFSFQDLMIFGIALNVCSMIGALAFSFIEDRIGSRMTIAITLVALFASTLLAVFVESKTAFWGCAIVIGLFIGPNQSASRAYLSRLTPPDKANEFFGFYAFSGKATAFIGPVLYGWVSFSFESQRAGMLVIPVLFLVGFVLLMLRTRSDCPEG